jgi:RNA recognition motif-containing protein
VISTFQAASQRRIRISKMSDQARWKATVYVGGLAPMVTAANLEAVFLPFGEIADVSIPYVFRAADQAGHFSNVSQ